MKKSLAVDCTSSNPSFLFSMRMPFIMNLKIRNMNGEKNPLYILSAKSGLSRIATLLIIVVILLGSIGSYYLVTTHFAEPTATPTSSSSSTPIPPTGWIKTYGGPKEDGGSSLVQTTDGGYAIAGCSEASRISIDVFFVKTDASGNMLWNKTYGGWRASSLVQTADGGYTIAGTIENSGGDQHDLFLVKIDQSGNMLWNKTYVGAESKIGYSLVQTADGGYAITGTISAPSYSYAFLVKTDASGNMLWNKTYTKDSSGSSLVQTADRGYAITGTIGPSNTFLVKTDASGNMLWNKTYAKDSSGSSLVQAIDGGYTIAGTVWNPGGSLNDVFLVKTDASGNMLWNKTYGGAIGDFGNALVQTGDGGYAITGYTCSFSDTEDSDVFLVKTDASGNMLWNKTYGEAKWDWGYALVQTGDGGYAITGETRSYGAWGAGDVILVKTDSTGNTP